MTDQAAYRRYSAEAERLLRLAETPMLVTVDRDITEAQTDKLRRALETKGFGQVVVAPPSFTIDVSATLRAAQVYATLALAAAQERVMPTDRPTDDNLTDNLTDTPRSRAWGQPGEYVEGS